MDAWQAVGLFFGGALFGAGLVIATLRAAHTPPEQVDRRRQVVDEINGQVNRIASRAPIEPKSTKTMWD
jgi:hypothetical protein